MNVVAVKNKPLEREGEMFTDSSINHQSLTTRRRLTLTHKY